MLERGPLWPDIKTSSTEERPPVGWFITRLEPSTSQLEPLPPPPGRLANEPPPAASLPEESACCVLPFPFYFLVTKYNPSSLNALPRWLTDALSALETSASVFPKGGKKKMGSYPKPPSPLGS